MIETERTIKNLMKFLQESGVDMSDNASINTAVERFSNLQESSDASLYGLTPSEQFMEKAEAALAEHQWDVARTCARKARRLDPANVDAGILELSLIEDEIEDGEYLQRISKMIAEAEAVLKERGALSDIGENAWYSLELRPYLRGRMAYAMKLNTVGCFSLAARELEALIALSPMDNQGCRFYLCAIYAALEDFDRFDALCRQFEDEVKQSPFFLLPKSILEYKKGDVAASLATFKKLCKMNEAWLELAENEMALSFDEQEAVESMSSYAMDSVEEARLCLSVNTPAIEMTSGYVDLVVDYAEEQVGKNEKR